MIRSFGEEPFEPGSIIVKVCGEKNFQNCSSCAKDDTCSGTIGLMIISLKLTCAAKQARRNAVLGKLVFGG